MSGSGLGSSECEYVSALAGELDSGRSWHSENAGQLNLVPSFLSSIA